MEDLATYAPPRYVYASHWVDRILLPEAEAERLGEMVRVECETCARREGIEGLCPACRVGTRGGFADHWTQSR